MSGKSLPTVTGDLAAVEAASVQWIERATDEEKDRLRALLKECDTTTVLGVMKFANAVAVEILLGGISPSLAAAAKPWVELVVANVWAMNQQAGTPEQTGIDVAVVMTEMRARINGPMTPTYTIAGPKDVFESEPVPAPFAKAAR